MKINKIISNFLLIIILLGSIYSCGTNKKAISETKAKEERLKKEKLDKAKQMRLDNELKVKAEVERKRIKLEKDKTDNKQVLIQKLESLFNELSKGKDKKSELVALCSSSDVPVLIIINDKNGKKDYDQPSTIKKYAEYLMDTKNFNTKIKDIKVDNYQKISKLVLIKKFK